MDVVGIGVPNIDLLAHIRELPKENQSTRLLEYSWQGGGKVPTAMVALARLGARVGMIGVVGDCCYGQFCINDFKYHKIDTSKIIIDKEKNTSFAIVLSEEKANGRNIIYKPGNLRSLLIEDLDREYITSAKYLHLAEVTPVTVKAAQWARESGVKVVFDADYYNPEREEMIPLIDVFIASEFYYDAVFKDKRYEANCRGIMMQGPSIVAFTLGDKGCIAMDKQGFYNLPAYKVNVCDTTGAGDVYHGAFIYGLLQNWTIPETAKFANAVSAIKCTRIGGRAAIPSISTVTKFIECGEIDYSEIDERVKYYEYGIARQFTNPF
jgi:sulfofructose kinase